MRGPIAPEVTPEMYKEVFEDHSTGRLVLDHLISRFTRGPSTTGGIDAVLKTYLHQGMRAPLDYIVNQINRAHGVTTGEDNELS